MVVLAFELWQNPSSTYFFLSAFADGKPERARSKKKKGERKKRKKKVEFLVEYSQQKVYGDYSPDPSKSVDWIRQNGTVWNPTHNLDFLINPDKATVTRHQK
jgi:hypothetical protein